MAAVYEAAFRKACVDPADFPTTGLPEVAFVGRSNVGKSSLMNLLLGRKNLVKVSGTPGKTQTINFFEVNARWYWVDLPGYGFARVPRTVQVTWKRLIEGYLTQRAVLRGVVLLLDPRRPPTDLDGQMKRWLNAVGIPVIYVATKSDQVSRAQRLPSQRTIVETLGLTPAETPCFVSAKTGEGKAELWRRLDRILLSPPPP